jgi:hypothetical protein
VSKNITCKCGPARSKFEFYIEPAVRDIREALENRDFVNRANRGPLRHQGLMDQGLMDQGFMDQGFFDLGWSFPELPWQFGRLDCLWAVNCYY